MLCKTLRGMILLDSIGMGKLVDLVNVLLQEGTLEVC